jgi:hypothetical protein
VGAGQFIGEGGALVLNEVMDRDADAMLDEMVRESAALRPPRAARPLSPPGRRFT